MIGLVTARSGRLQLGADDVASVASEIWILGHELHLLDVVPTSTSRLIELGHFAPLEWTQYLLSEIGDSSIVLSASPDGRDLAGRLAETFGLALFAGCTRLSATTIRMPRFGSAGEVHVDPPKKYVATMQVRTTTGPRVTWGGEIETVSLPANSAVHVLSEVAPDLQTLDLADAARIVAGGAGLTSAQSFDTLLNVSTQLHAAMGATRVITDRGWVPYRRQIGTTGATVSPQLYIAFGISGAVQHTSGILGPQHIVSINTDLACPMSQMADLAIVASADETLVALSQRLKDGS